MVSISTTQAAELSVLQNVAALSKVFMVNLTSLPSTVQLF